MCVCVCVCVCERERERESHCISERDMGRLTTEDQHGLDISALNKMMHTSEEIKITYRNCSSASLVPTTIKNNKLERSGSIIEEIMVYTFAQNTYT